MYHRIASSSISEINRVLGLIQKGMQNQKLDAKGISNRTPETDRSSSTKLLGKVKIKTIVEVGVTTTLPVILNATITTTYPSFGFGANWGESWGL